MSTEVFGSSRGSLLPTEAPHRPFSRAFPQTYVRCGGLSSFAGEMIRFLPPSEAGRRPGLPKRSPLAMHLKPYPAFLFPPVLPSLEPYVITTFEGGRLPLRVQSEIAAFSSALSLVVCFFFVFSLPPRFLPRFLFFCDLARAANCRFR